jgi:tRNA(Arg) A34 adenosine deaminase TadA
VGAAITTPDGLIVATGRNRLVEQDPGDDHLAGTSLAHAEINALAKLAWPAQSTELTLWTTLQPCLQCAGAIRMSRIAHVQVLAPDPLFRGIESMRDLSPFVARHWPEHARHDADAIAAFSLLLPAHLMTFWYAPSEEWEQALPRVTALARELVASHELVDLAREAAPVEHVLGTLWSRLLACVDEVDALWHVV